MKNDPEQYTDHSGGAEGADIWWDRIGRKFGLTKFKHWRPKDLKDLCARDHRTMIYSVESAAKALGRPYQFRGVELVQRNWLQIYHAEAIYAISRIIEPEEVDKGFINQSGKQVVSGGTGWAVEMAIQEKKHVFVFDMITNKWHWWFINEFVPCPIPTLTFNFAGIGSRLLTREGLQAITDVYENTFKESEL